MENGPKTVNRNAPTKISDLKGEVSNDCLFILFIIIVGRIFQEVLLGEAACLFEINTQKLY